MKPCNDLVPGTMLIVELKWNLPVRAGGFSQSLTGVPLHWHVFNPGDVLLVLSRFEHFYRHVEGLNGTIFLSSPTGCIYCILDCDLFANPFNPFACSRLPLIALDSVIL